MSENDTIKFIKLDEVVEIVLHENASTGYRWMHQSEDVFEMVGAVYIDEYNPGLVGAGRDIKYSFRPKQEGELRLRLEYRRSWEKSAPPAQVFEEVVMVEQ